MELLNRFFQFVLLSVNIRLLSVLIFVHFLCFRNCIFERFFFISRSPLILRVYIFSVSARLDIFLRFCSHFYRFFQFALVSLCDGINFSNFRNSSIFSLVDCLLDLSGLFSSILARWLLRDF